MRKKSAAWVLISSGFVAAFVLTSLLVYVSRGPKVPDTFIFVGRNAHGLREYNHTPTGIVFVLLPGGAYFQGTDARTIAIFEEYDWERLKGMSGPEVHADPAVREAWRTTFSEALSAEAPVHRVRISPFLMSKYEVTQDQWGSIMGNSRESTKGVYPVVDVSISDCAEFARRSGLDLPTEAEWEYACRGNDNEFIPQECVEIGWVDENSGARLREVGQRAPNAFGLHDMLGNAGEYCKDRYNPNFYESAEAQRDNPYCSDGSSTDVILRGGTYLTSVAYARPGARNVIPVGAASATSEAGLRVVYRCK